MSLVDMQVFNSQLQTSIVTKLEQQSDKFNAASNGALILSNAGNMGDFSQETFWNNVSDALRDVDAYSSNDAVSSTALTQGIISTVKTMKGFGPILWEPNQLTWIRKNPEEALSVISTSLSQAMMQDQLNKAIGALVAGISNVAGATNDVSASAGVTQSALNATHALFGDSSMNLTTQVMTGSVYHGLIGKAIDNANDLFQAGSVRVVDILGKISIVTDSPALYEAGTPNKAKVLCLTSGAAMIEPNGDFKSAIVETTGKKRLETNFQAEYTENVGLKGYTWDEVNGGKSPVTADLNTGSNWDITLGLKQTAGVILIADADL